MQVINQTNQDYWFGPLHLKAGVGTTLTVDDTSETSLYRNNDTVADALNNLYLAGKVTVGTGVNAPADPFPRPTGTPLLLHGDGSPEGLVYASQGSLYMRRDANGATGLYVKTTGVTSDTGWQAYTTAQVTGGFTLLYDSGYLSAAAASFDTGGTGFSTSFTHLVMRLIARGDTVATSVHLQMQFNGDTAANYDSDLVYGGFTAVTASENLGLTYAGPSASLSIPGASSGADYFGLVNIDVPFYSQPTAGVYKPWTATSIVLLGSRLTGVSGGWWKSAGSPISRVVMSPASGNFVAGSRLMVYAYN